MRRKARPIWWLMALGVILTLAVGAWVYFHQAATIGVVDKAKGLVSKATPSPVLENAQEECGIVADYARNKGLKEVSPILKSGTVTRIGGVSTENVGPLDCGVAFRNAGVATTTALRDVEHRHAIVFSRVYVSGPEPVTAYFRAFDRCPLCGKSRHVALQRVSGKWVVVEDVVDALS